MTTRAADALLIAVGVLLGASLLAAVVWAVSQL